MARKTGETIRRNLRIWFVPLHMRRDALSKKKMCPTGPSIGGFAMHKRTQAGC
jgi:hypothetical protein